MMLRGLSLLLLLVTPRLAAWAAPQAVVPPLRGGADVSEADRAGYEERLRKALAGKVELFDGAATKQALTKAGASGACEDAACARKVADAAGARFVVVSHLANESEIYKLTLAIFDGAHDKMAATVSKSCELCAVAEVNGIIDAAVAEVAPAFAVPAPQKAPPPPPPPVKVEKAPLQVRSDPNGSKVTVDGKPAGETPLTIRLEPGSHKLTVAKDGFVTDEREVKLPEAGLELTVTLKPVPPAVVVAPPVEEPARTASYAPWGWTLTLGGVLAAGGGAFLVVLDGEVTCKNKGRDECPTVYNTKIPGMVLLGAGAAAMGVGITLLAVDPGGVPVSGQATLQPTADGGAVLHWAGRF